MTLEINQLSCRYGKTNVISDLSLRVEQGFIYCLLGASGCGKTTVLNAIAGIHKINGGEIKLGEKTLSDSSHHLPPEQRGVGIIFQDFALFPHLTVAENIAFGITKLAKSEQKKRTAELLKLIGLSEFSQRYPNQLSGGQQQRVAIARALAPSPSILLMDEPFANIDQQFKMALIEEIRGILKQQHITTIFVTHNRNEAFALADQLAVMAYGEIIQTGSPKELYENPVNRLVAELLGNVNLLQGEIINNKLRLEDAVIIENEFNNQQRKNLDYYQDGKVKLLVRPQFLQAGYAASSHLVVTKRLFMGEQELIEISDGEQFFLAIEGEKQQLQANDKVNLSVLPHNLTIF